MFDCPLRSDFTSVPVSIKPASQVSVRKYSWRACRFSATMRRPSFSLAAMDRLPPALNARRCLLGGARLYEADAGQSSIDNALRGLRDGYQRQAHLGLAQP